ncbi:MAG: flagellin [Planctomycetota bacterium]|nr:flagellin [Planctomycetota bacterium]
MSRINTNIEAVRALTRLGGNQANLSLRLERLSTGLRINRGKDDPAGLIASERLRSELNGITQAIANSQRTINVLSVAEGALNEVSTLLLEVRSLITATSNEGALSPDEVAANQLQLDSIIESINRIANTTQFAGQKLLDGSIGYTVSGQTTSQVANARIFGARLPDNGTVTVNVEVTNSAELGTATFAQGSAAGLASAVTIEVSGNLGTETISFASGTNLSAVVAAINNFTTLTGVTAAMGGTSGTSSVVLNSQKYGDDEFVTVRTISGTFTTAAGSSTTDFGVDVGVLINGQTAKSDGLEATMRTTAIDIELTLASGFATQTVSASTMSITGGGARFQISPSITGAGQVNLGIPSISTTNLGNAVDGFLSTLKTGGTNEVAAGNFTKAEIIANQAVNQVATMRGRLGAFQKNVIETNINSMSVAFENVSASESVLRDADMAEEISKLTLAQILVQSSIQVLSIANQIPTAVLQLIGG